MNLIKSTLRIDFQSAFEPWLEIRSLIRTLTEDHSSEVQGQPIVIDRQGRKQRVVLTVRGLRIEQEAAKSTGQSNAEALRLVDEVNTITRLPVMGLLRYDLFFIEPYALPFHELVAVFKDHFLKPNPLTDAATDVGFSLDEHGEDVTRHVQIGPMEPNQLRSQFLVWEMDGLPEQFVFVSTGVEHNREMSFSLESFEEMLQTDSVWQVDRAQTIMTSLQKSRGI